MQADLPYPEMTFFAEGNQIMIQKCDPMDNTNQEDAECVEPAAEPYFKYYTIVITGTLNDEEMTSDYITFDVTIGPSCDDDTITYESDVKSQFNGVYYLGAT